MNSSSTPNRLRSKPSEASQDKFAFERSLRSFSPSTVKPPRTIHVAITDDGSVLKRAPHTHRLDPPVVDDARHGRARGMAGQSMVTYRSGRNSDLDSERKRRRGGLGGPFPAIHEDSQAPSLSSYAMTPIEQVYAEQAAVSARRRRGEGTPMAARRAWADDAPEAMVLASHLRSHGWADDATRTRKVGSGATSVVDSASYVSGGTAAQPLGSRSSAVAISPPKARWADDFAPDKPFPMQFASHASSLRSDSVGSNWMGVAAENGEQKSRTENGAQKIVAVEERPAWVNPSDTTATQTSPTQSRSTSQAVAANMLQADIQETQSALRNATANTSDLNVTLRPQTRGLGMNDDLQHQRETSDEATTKRILTYRSNKSGSRQPAPTYSDRPERWADDPKMSEARSASSRVSASTQHVASASEGSSKRIRASSLKQPQQQGPSAQFVTFADEHIVPSVNFSSTNQPVVQPTVRRDHSLRLDAEDELDYASASSSRRRPTPLMRTGPAATTDVLRASPPPLQWSTISHVIDDVFRSIEQEEDQQRHDESTHQRALGDDPQQAVVDDERQYNDAAAHVSRVAVNGSQGAVPLSSEAMKRLEELLFTSPDLEQHHHRSTHAVAGVQTDHRTSPVPPPVMTATAISVQTSPPASPARVVEAGPTNRTVFGDSEAIRGINRSSPARGPLNAKEVHGAADGVSNRGRNRTRRTSFTKPTGTVAFRTTAVQADVAVEPSSRLTQPSGGAHQSAMDSRFAAILEHGDVVMSLQRRQEQLEDMVRRQESHNLAMQAAQEADLVEEVLRSRRQIAEIAEQDRVQREVLIREERERAARELAHAVEAETRARLMAEERLQQAVDLKFEEAAGALLRRVEARERDGRVSPSVLKPLIAPDDPQLKFQHIVPIASMPIETKDVQPWDQLDDATGLNEKTKNLSPEPQPLLPPPAALLNSKSSIWDRLDNERTDRRDKEEQVPKMDDTTWPRDSGSAGVKVQPLRARPSSSIAGMQLLLSHHREEEDDDEGPEDSRPVHPYPAVHTAGNRSTAHPAADRDSPIEPTRAVHHALPIAVTVHGEVVSNPDLLDPGDVKAEARAVAERRAVSAKLSRHYAMTKEKQHRDALDSLIAEGRQTVQQHQASVGIDSARQDHHSAHSIEQLQRGAASTVSPRTPSSAYSSRSASMHSVIASGWQQEAQPPQLREQQHLIRLAPAVDVATSITPTLATPAATTRDYDKQADGPVRLDHDRRGLAHGDVTANRLAETMRWPDSGSRSTAVSPTLPVSSAAPAASTTLRDLHRPTLPVAIQAAGTTIAPPAVVSSKPLALHHLLRDGALPKSNVAATSAGGERKPDITKESPTDERATACSASESGSKFYALRDEYFRKRSSR